jgi:hypothetical protein
MSFATCTHPPAPARERPAPHPDPLGEFRSDLAAVLAVLEVSPVPALGRKRANRLGHALEAARREVRRALEVVGAGPGSGPA